MLVKGDKVKVMNRTYEGKSFVEGVAVLLRPLSERRDRWRVRFEDGDEVDRFVQEENKAAK